MKKTTLICILAAMAICMGFAGCGKEKTAKIQITPCEETVVEAGDYAPLKLDASMSGTKDDPTVIRVADGAKATISLDTGEIQSGEGDLDENCGIRLTNVDNIIIEGFTIEGGTCGIYYESTRDRGRKPLENISIKNCDISGIVGVHGLCVYAANDNAAIKNLTVDGCEISDCKCGDSESLVMNGNIDGFTISNNIIHNNNNIGIDMVGFEGTARHTGGHKSADPFEVDFARNGRCFGNTVYNISAEGNPAYLKDRGNDSENGGERSGESSEENYGEYDLCADGIYVDGGQDIEIYNNYVYNCDIGVEAATEHSPDDNEMFRVTGISVHDNVIKDCNGLCGLCFGGYNGSRGFTEKCEFYNNTLIDNGTQVIVQRSKDNSIHDNLFVGGDTEIEYNSDCAAEDMINDFRHNVWRRDGSSVLDGMKSKIRGIGSGFVPE